MLILTNVLVASDYKDSEEDDLHKRAKSGFYDDTKHLGHLPCQFLAGETDSICGWDHCYVVENEDQQVVIGKSKVLS